MKPGLALGAGLLGAGLTASAVLIATGHDPISTDVRASNAARAVVGGLAIHLLFRVPHDPISWAGEGVARAVAVLAARRAAA